MRQKTFIKQTSLAILLYFICLALAVAIDLIFFKVNFIKLKVIRIIDIATFIRLIEYKFVNKIHKDFISLKGILLLG